VKNVKIIDKVLLVEDDETDCFLSKYLLEHSGLVREVIVKPDGHQALNYLTSECRFKDEYPSLILLDLRMPRGDGFKFITEYEKLEVSRKHNIALAILSYSGDGEAIIKLNKLGRYHFINKPLTEDKLIDLYHRFFRNWKFPESNRSATETILEENDKGASLK
jgi:CheY-like chemotaxis protein